MAEPQRHTRLDLAVPLVASIAVLLFVGLDVVFRVSIPAASDLPGHLLPPEILRTQLLPEGRLRGWTNDWFAGFPLYYYYFPLPGLAVAVLSWIVEPAVALRAVTILAPVALPWTLYAFARAGGVSRAGTAAIVLVGSSFLLMVSYFALGGNLLSTLAGEFSYAWSLNFAILYLTVLGKAEPKPGDGILAGLMLAAMVLSHVLPPIAVFLGTLPFMFVRSRRVHVVTSWFVAGGLTAFWTVPMALRLGFVGGRNWTYVPSLADVLPLEVLILLPGALMGLWLARRLAAVRMLACAGLAGVVVAALPQDLVMRSRLLPVWFLTIHVLVGAGLGLGLTRLRHRARWAVLAVVTCLLPWLFIATSRDPGEVATFSKRILEGIDAKPGREDFQSLVTDLQGLEPGRVHWELDDSLENYGGSYAFSLIPYWTDHTVVHGLLAESSPSFMVLPRIDRRLARTPPPLNLQRDADTATYAPRQAVEQLRMMGVRYLVTISQATTDTVMSLGASALGHRGRLSLFDISPEPMVEALDCWEVAQGIAGPFKVRAEEWFAHADGRSPWLVTEAAPLHESAGQCRSSAEATVRGVTIDDDRISFTTERVGVPHLIRISYFPNWRASGAQGPYLAAPWFMVVVPTQTDVSLEFGPTWVELAAWSITAVTAVLLLLVSGYTTGSIRRKRGRSRT